MINLFQNLPTGGIAQNLPVARITRFVQERFGNIRNMTPEQRRAVARATALALGIVINAGIAMASRRDERIEPYRRDQDRMRYIQECTACMNHCDAYDSIFAIICYLLCQTAGPC